jgi:hypothetical protein
MSFCGISVSKDLACVAAVADARADGLLGCGQPALVEMYTFSDGRAFRNCPYWTQWKSSSQFFLNEAAVEEIDFARVLIDFRTRHECCAIGFTRDQLLLVDPCALAIPKECPAVDTALRDLNRHAAQADRSGYLFPPNTALQYMWSSLPLLNGARIFPTAVKVATGRYDAVRALTNAMVCAAHFEELASGRTL